jgi:glutathione S-transferase
MQPIKNIIVFGAPYSVYVRAVRLALEEKGVHYELIVYLGEREDKPAIEVRRDRPQQGSP